MQADFLLLLDHKCIIEKSKIHDKLIFVNLRWFIKKREITSKNICFKYCVSNLHWKIQKPDYYVLSASSVLAYFVIKAWDNEIIVLKPQKYFLSRAQCLKWVNDKMKDSKFLVNFSKLLVVMAWIIFKMEWKFCGFHHRHGVTPKKSRKCSESNSPECWP